MRDKNTAHIPQIVQQLVVFLEIDVSENASPQLAIKFCINGMRYILIYHWLVDIALFPSGIVLKCHCY